jgi:glycosyltransferase 2 family protein
MPAIRVRTIRAAKIGFAVILLAVLVVHVGYQPIVDVLSEFAWWWLAVLFGVRVMALFVQTQRWRLFLASLNIRASTRRLFRSYWVARFFGGFSPGQLGGDVYRVLYGLDAGARRTEVASTVLVERVSGLIGLMLVGAGAGCAGFDALRAAGLQFLPVPATLGAVVLWLIATTRAPSRWILGAVQQLPESRARSIASDLVRALAIHVARRQTLAIGIALGIVFYMFLTLEAFLAFHALGIDVDPVLVMIVVPVIALISSIPITINGWGAAEVTSLLLYTQLGVSSPAALSVALLTRVTGALISGSGGLILLWEHARKFSLYRVRIRPRLS